MLEQWIDWEANLATTSLFAGILAALLWCIKKIALMAATELIKLIVKGLYMRIRRLWIFPRTGFRWTFYMWLGC